jgi:hypothetical protein
MSGKIHDNFSENRYSMEIEKLLSNIDHLKYPSPYPSPSRGEGIFVDIMDIMDMVDETLEFWLFRPACPPKL